MKTICLVMLFTCIVCCTKTDSEIGLNQELETAIIDYQKEYSIPKINDNNDKFIYNVYFGKENNDTLVVIQRSAGGVSKKAKGYGVFESKSLLPTFVYDDLNIGGSYIISKFRKIDKKYIWNDKEDARESFPPVYVYKIKDDKLVFYKIDTIWGNW